jgi:hypothetical protein
MLQDSSSLNDIMQTLQRGDGPSRVRLGAKDTDDHSDFDRPAVESAIRAISDLAPPCHRTSLRLPRKRFCPVYGKTTTTKLIET